MARLDQVLVERGLFPSREKAQRAIMAGEVRINGNVARKASERANIEDALHVTEREKYVSRGGLKLEHALLQFALDVTGSTALDIGASTGGFTDCLLQRGASRVYAIDVGQGQLAWKLRQDARVVVMERTNARTLTLSSFPPDYQAADIAVVDCSFISLRKVLPPVVDLVRDSGIIVALIKPQFEAGKAEADRGAGVIRDPEIHGRVVAQLAEFIRAEGRLRWKSVTESPILGPAGNKEFLVHIEKDR